MQSSWSHFRGPSGNGVGRTTNYGPSSNYTLWKKLVSGSGGTSFSSPVLSTSGTIYIGSTDKNLYAFDPSGALLWGLNPVSYPLYGSPAVASDGTIFVGANNLYQVTSSGSTKYYYYSVNYFQHSSPLISAEGFIYIGDGASSNFLEFSLLWAFSMSAVWFV
jgi:outer membrane protein assembly factor BamB